MKTIKQLKGRNIFACIGLGLLLIGLTGETCTEDRDVEIVAVVEITADIVASGSTNVYSGTTMVQLQDQVDIEALEAEYDIDIQSLTVESAFFRVVQGDLGAPDRTVSGNVGVQYPPLAATVSLIDYASVAVNDPQYQSWTPVPLQAAGVAQVNEALADLVAGTATDPIAFSVSGTSTPIGQPTSFVWGAMLRLNAVGIRTVTVVDPI